jgi:hypothetical protein
MGEEMQQGCLLVGIVSAGIAPKRNYQVRERVAASVAFPVTCLL